jgi:hypothetical protein
MNFFLYSQYVSEFSIFPISIFSLKKSESYLNDVDEQFFREKKDQDIKVFTKTDAKQKGLIITLKNSQESVVSSCELRQKNYKTECLNLFKELNNPDPSKFFHPPLAKPPDNLMNEFTQNGEMPITKYWYFNDVYSDANQKEAKNKEIITKSEVDGYRLKDNNRVANYYGDWYNHQLMPKYSNYIKGKKLTVMGTIKPWLEAIALDAGAAKVITLDYTRKEYEQKDILEWLHVYDYLNYLIEKKKIEEFDNAATFSSLEHSGLGRYGDPLDPNGDIKAVKQVHCMIKPGGLFFLGLPTSGDNSSYIEFNAHRVYGYKRLNKLFAGWDVVEDTGRGQVHSVFVLKKKQIEGC